MSRARGCRSRFRYRTTATRRCGTTSCAGAARKSSAPSTTAITTPTGDYTLQHWLEKIYLPYNIPGFDNPKQWDSMYWQEVLGPPRIAGLITMAISYQNPNEQPRAAWQYYPGERRVRRAPEISYDTPYNNADGLATVDDYDMFNGALDRYDWKLIGRARNLRAVQYQPVPGSGAADQRHPQARLASTPT